MTKEALLQPLQQYLVQHQQLLADWSNLSHQQLSASPAPGSWSANECLQHLISYGHYYLPALQQALAQASPQAADGPYTYGWLGGWFARTMLPQAGTGLPKTKMPAPADHRPQQILPSAEVLATFSQQLQWLQQLLQQATHRSLQSPRIPITISRLVRLKPGDVLAFLVAHNERHLQQAMRALQATRPAQP